MRLLHKLGIGFIDLLILGGGLIFIYMNTIPVESWGLFGGDALFMLVVICILYLGVTVFVSLCLTYMREDNSLAKLIKGFVATVMVVSLYSYLLFPALWVFGYEFPMDVRNILIIISIIRSLVKIALGRRFGGGGGPE